MGNFDFSDWDIDAVRALVDEDDHNYYEPEEPGEDYLHAYWDCETCEAEKYLERLAYLERAEMPGQVPPALPDHFHSYCSVEASELSIGDFAAADRKPGVQTNEYYELMEIIPKSGKLVLRWRLANTTGETFLVSYEPDEYVNAVLNRKSKAARDD